MAPAEFVKSGDSIYIQLPGRKVYVCTVSEAQTEAVAKARLKTAVAMATLTPSEKRLVGGLFLNTANKMLAARELRSGPSKRPTRTTVPKPVALNFRTLFAQKPEVMARTLVANKDKLQAELDKNKTIAIDEMYKKLEKVSGYTIWHQMTKTRLTTIGVNIGDYEKLTLILIKLFLDRSYADTRHNAVYSAGFGASGGTGYPLNIFAELIRASGEDKSLADKIKEIGKTLDSNTLLAFANYHAAYEMLKTGKKTDAAIAALKGMWREVPTVTESKTEKEVKVATIQVPEILSRFKLVISGTKTIEDLKKEWKTDEIAKVIPEGRMEEVYYRTAQTAFNYLKEKDSAAFNRFLERKYGTLSDTKTETVRMDETIAGGIKRTTRGRMIRSENKELPVKALQEYMNQKIGSDRRLSTRITEYKPLEVDGKPDTRLLERISVYTQALGVKTTEPTKKRATITF